VATVLDNAGKSDKLFVSFPITKFESTDDGDIVVYGKATDGSVDSDDQIVDPEWSGPALQKWLNTGGNVRVQHNPALYPAGKGLTVEETDDGHYVKALIVEPTAKKLVRTKVLQAYSVGISRPVVERDITGKARGGIIKGGELFELSLVDRPANKNCSITLSKSETELSKSEDGSDSTAWTYGDLEGHATAKAAGTGLARRWLAERAEWLAGEPDPSSATQGPEYLAKRAEWQRWHAKGEDTGLVDGGYEDWLTKREMDLDVGGGVDREKIPGKDFAGRNRSFPIVTPGDVSDAASSIGRAGEDNYSSDELKRRIIRIARRKGASFVAELPESWKKEMDATSKAKKPKKGGKKPTFVIGAREGAHRTEEIPVVKGYDGDKCPVCGEDVDDGVCSCCSAFPCTCKPSDGGDGSTATLSKCYCSGCGKDCDDDDRFCSQCGAACVTGKSLLPTRAAKKKSKKAKKRFLPPAGEHREPDGDTTVEQLEQDAGMPTKKDPKPDKVPSSVDAKTKKSAKVNDPQLAMKRMHDALCAAYHASDVMAEYSVKSLDAAIDRDYLWAEAAKAMSNGDIESATVLGRLATDADALKSSHPRLLAEARDLVHKSFTDMYPTVRLTPGNPPKPGSFQRPYILSGHAPLTAAGKKPMLPPGGRSLDPGKFDRGPLTSGHERPSPASKGNNDLGSVATGSGRDLYAAAALEYTANRMKAIHDHIEQTTVGLCPMAPSNTVLPPRNGSDAMPAPRPALDTAAGAAVSTKAVKSMIDKATNPYKKKIKALKRELDELGRQPDPAQAPMRGTVRKAAGVAPVERRSLAAEAQDKAVKAEKAAYVQYLRNLTESGDPDIRERAHQALINAGLPDLF